MMASVCSAIVKALRVEENVMRKFFAKNQENEQ
jgi:hypothetical protein